MCSVGDSFGFEIEGSVEAHKYKCNHCSKEFKSIGDNVTCPKCYSKDIKCID